MIGRRGRTGVDQTRQISSACAHKMSVAGRVRGDVSSGTKFCKDIGGFVENVSAVPGLPTKFNAAPQDGTVNPIRDARFEPELIQAAP